MKLCLTSPGSWTPTYPYVKVMLSMYIGKRTMAGGGELRGTRQAGFLATMCRQSFMVGNPQGTGCVNVGVMGVMT